MTQAARKWDVLDAELLDTLQFERVKRGLPMHVRTAETEASYPRPSSRALPLLACPYCGKKRCREHRDLPPLDPFYNA